MSKHKSLTDLFNAMTRNATSVIDKGGYRSDLPTFGGTAPSSTLSVWSWSETHMIVGSCADDLELVEREDAIIEREANHCGREWSVQGGTEDAEWGDGLTAEDIAWIEDKLGREMTSDEIRDADLVAEAAFTAHRAQRSTSNA